MKTWIRVGAAVLMLSVAGCGRRPSATPRETFETFKQAMVNGDFESAWELLADASRRDMEAAADEVRQADDLVLLENAQRMGVTPEALKTMDGKAFFVAGSKAAAKRGDRDWDRAWRAEFVRAEIDGDRARVYVEIDGETLGDPLLLVRENGRWRVNLAGE